VALDLLSHTEGLTPSYGGKFRNEQFSGGRCPASKLAEKPSTASLAITSAVHGPELIALREALLRARQATGDALKDLDFPAIPSRGQILVGSSVPCHWRKSALMPFSRVDQRALSGDSLSQCDGSRTGEGNLHNGRPVEGLSAAGAF